MHVEANPDYCIKNTLYRHFLDVLSATNLTDPWKLLLSKSNTQNRFNWKLQRKNFRTTKTAANHCCSSGMSKNIAQYARN